MCERAIGTWAPGVWGINTINLQYNRYISMTCIIHEIFGKGTYRMQFDMKCPNRESSRPVSEYSSQNGVRLTRFSVEWKRHTLMSKEWANLPTTYVIKSPTIAQHMPEKWNTHSNDSMKHHSGCLTGRNSGVHVALPDLAWTGLWMSTNLHSLENMCRVVENIG